jgi:hypothetical protein
VVGLTLLILVYPPLLFPALLIVSGAAYFHFRKHFTNWH